MQNDLGPGDAARPAGYVHIGSDLDVHGTALLPLNQWSHLAVTYNGASMRLYVNGVQVGSQAVSGSVAVSNGSLRFGGNAIWSEFFRGLIDEVRLCNRALSGAEILADMGTPIQ